ncbi:MAG: VWA domain-containing protein [Ketobacter sp.]|nr:VWA domain-containing protein [Ketobacter sp.]
MNIFNSKFGYGTLLFLFSTMAGMSAHADDTEIFFGGASSSAIKPNVLFILDTSGSMSNRDGGTDTRLERMKSAFNELLSGMNNVNVGLMRFNDPGGPILYPIKDIDEVVTSNNTYSGTAISRIGSSASDAEESSTGVVTLDNSTLEMTTRSFSGGVQSIQVDVNSSADDGEETLSNNTMSYNNSPSLEAPIDDNNTSDLQANGVIFRNLGIPKDANILSASIRFDIEERDNYLDQRNVDLRITGQTGTPIVNFNDENITNRSKTTSSVLWQITDSPRAGRSIETTDISSVIQELVNQADWSNTSDAALFMHYAYGNTPSGNRNFSSYDSSYDEPRLYVQYEVASTAVTQTIGLRFEDLDIPQGVTITSAKLDFTAANSNSNATVFTIAAEDTDNSSAFTDTDNDISDRTLTTDVASWTPAGWTAGTSYSTEDQSVDLTDMVQTVVNRAGWCGGNAMTFVISGAGNRSAISYDGSSTYAPQVTITYDPDSVPDDGGCVSNELSYRINSSANDAEHRINNGDLSTGGNKLTFGYDGSNEQAVGLRFTNIQIPNGSTVTSAYIEFTAYESDSSSASFTIYAQNSDNPSYYSNSRKPNSLSTIGTTVSWPNIEAWSGNSIYRTPDIAPLVQALVNRGGWSEGNAMSFIIKNTSGSGTRDARSYDNDATRAPKLVINVAGTPSELADTTRDVLRDIITNLDAGGYTPIVDTLYEAALYYRGDNVYWGRIRGDTSVSRSDYSDHRYFRVSHEDSYTGGTLSQPSGCTDSNLNSSNCIGEQITGTPVYDSPILDQCQPNHIVLLTDGEPTQNRSQALIRSLTGDTSCDTSGYGACGEELAAFLQENDQSSTVINSQRIKTHTIGFNIDDPYLGRIASNGGGGYYTASSSSDLLTAFDEILRSVLNVDTTFVSPGVTVNAFNRLNHRNEIYFALFQPQDSERWPGNLKRYKITSSGSIVDRNGADAIDQDTGTFKDTAVSYWNTVLDGNNTELGGAAYQVPNSGSRNIYTYHSDSSSTLLTEGRNLLTYSNTYMTKARLAIEGESDSYHQNLINWIRGQDVLDSDEDNSTTDQRNQLSDPLHSAPYLVTYGGTDDAPDITIYYGDNEGLLHAIDAATGQEQFAFVPEELLSNFDKLYRNNGSNDHPYGMDGYVTAWIHDVDADSVIETADSDHVYLYAGMRRGGRSYYALNVTNRNAPRLLWSITGGSGDYSDLGQSWARPIKTKINIDGTLTDVLIISGGYDPDQDDVNVRTTDSMGNAIFIVNAATGDLIWSAGNGVSHDLNLADMDYSIPASVRAIDVDGNGTTDQFYVGDMGAQIWRFDVNNGNAVASLVTGGVIANLGGSTTASARRFFHELDTSIVVKNGVRQLALTLGSGFQAHPLSEEVSDRFYMILQSDLFNAPADTDSDGSPDYITLTESDLFDTTNNRIVNGSDTERAAASTALNNAKGWYIQLEGEYNSTTAPGEKVLSRALTLDGVLYFTTYLPSATVSANCEPTAGVSKLYSVNLYDASPLNNQTATTDRHTILDTVGLPPNPVHLRISDGDGTSDLISVGSEIFQHSVGDIITKTFWYSY